MKNSNFGYNLKDEKKRMKILPDPEILLKLVNTCMPFGRYKDYLLIDLPESYIIWFSQKGFPEGQLGEMLRMLYEIKLNGLKHLFEPLRQSG